MVQDRKILTMEN